MSVIASLGLVCLFPHPEGLNAVDIVPALNLHQIEPGLWENCLSEQPSTFLPAVVALLGQVAAAVHLLPFPFSFSFLFFFPVPILSFFWVVMTAQ